MKMLECEGCGVKVQDISKYRGRFQRRHFRDNVCGNFARKQEEGRQKLAAELLAARLKELKELGVEENGTRVDMSGDVGVAGEVATVVVQGDVTE